MLRETAASLLLECGHLIRAMSAGLSMPDWPEGVRRAINFTFAPAMLAPAVGAAAGDALLASLREADGGGYDFAGD
jgi:heme A synthase